MRFSSKLAEALQQKITEFEQAAATPVSVEFNKDELDQCEMSEDEFRMLSFDAYVEVDFPNGDPSKYFKPVVADGLLDKELFKSFLADTSGVSGVLPSEHELLWVAQEALGQNGGGETDGITLVRPEWGNLGLKADHLSHAARAWSIYVENKVCVARIFHHFDDSFFPSFSLSMYQGNCLSPVALADLFGINHPVSPVYLPECLPVY